MTRVSSYVLKTASRCNLNCSYCYMYNLGDETYKGQPKFMSLLTVTALAQRLKSYCEESDIRFVQIVFHGGEPLLVKPEYYEKCLAIFKSIAPEIEYSFTVQTNGVLLDQEWYSFFNSNNITIGISIDGPEKYHDEFRVFHNGKGSYKQVADAVKLGKQNELAGILMVVNTKIPPEELYADMKELEVNSWNLLLPDGHFDQLPEGFDAAKMQEEDYTPYADWLIDVYKIWKKDRERPVIRFFQSLIEMVMGEEGIGNQNIGRKANGVVVIETNGNIEIADSIRACYEGITRNDINVHTNKIEDLFEDEIFDMYYHAHDKVCEQCLNCPIYDICGGGFLGHRYSNDNGFDNPTMYCKDMIRLVSFIQNDIIESLPSDVTTKLELEPLTYEEIIDDLRQPSLTRIDKQVKQSLVSFKQTEAA